MGSKKARAKHQMNAVYGSSSKATKTRRCGECEGCMRDDCGQCPACADKPRFGGRGSKKKVENRLQLFTCEYSKVRINNCKVEMNNCKIKINDCKIKTNNCKLRVYNVAAVCCADKPRFGGRGSKKNVENRLKYLQTKRNNCKIMINDCKVKINECKIKVNDFKIKMNGCKIKIYNFKIKTSNVESVYCVDKPRFGGHSCKNKVVEIFIKMLNCLKTRLV